MLTGVQTLVLAVAATLPFTPPAGWVQLPQSAVGVRVSNVWQGPKTASGAKSTFSAVAFPFPATLDVLASSQSNAAAASKVLKPISTSALTLCGTPARSVVTRVSAGAASGIMQRIVTVKNGYAYMLMYSRPGGTSADPAVLQAMRGFCPSGTASMPPITMPAGWTKSSGDLQMTGMWMGTRPGEMMMLMRGTQMGSLTQLFSAAKSGAVQGKSAKDPVHITTEKTVSMCGNPGMLVGMSVDAGPMPVTIHSALTQADGTAYVLTYTELGKTPADPAAMTALQSLCAAGASPSPSPAPSATP